jgi:hypothetical protein
MQNYQPARRRFIKIAVVGVAAAPLGTGFRPGTAHAQAMVNPSSPTAQALNFVTDASKSTVRKDAKSRCDNCNFYTVKTAGPDGSCAVLGGLVPAAGWCTSWVAKQ